MRVITVAVSEYGEYLCPKCAEFRVLKLRDSEEFVWDSEDRPSRCDVCDDDLEFQGEYSPG